MVTTENTKEEQILRAAHNVFTRKGLSGARMQEIADEAGINKASLHYYFRSKEQLFEAIFAKAFQQFIPSLFKILDDESTLEDKIKSFVGHYIDGFGRSSYIPVFMINEIHQNPDRLKAMTSKVHGIRDSNFARQLEQGIKEGRYKAVEPLHLFSNLLALSIFPLLAKPILSGVWNLNEDAYQNFLQEKKEQIPELIIQSLKIMEL